MNSSLILLFLFISAILASEDVVMTKYGPVRGLVMNGYRQFQGVPYAAPPLGALRYKVIRL